MNKEHDETVLIKGGVFITSLDLPTNHTDEIEPSIPASDTPQTNIESEDE